MAKDPVCGMQVNESTKYQSEHMGQKFYFCSQGCKSTFAGNPMKYMGGHDVSMGHHCPVLSLFRLAEVGHKGKRRKENRPGPGCPSDSTRPTPQY